MPALVIIIFIAGYIAIAFEQSLKINKAATALIIGVLCWTCYAIFTPDKDSVVTQLAYHTGEVSQILFFLLGAMTVVELIDAHNGFEIITSRIRTKNKKKLIWIIGFLAFFLSAILDNLTTTIVMISVVRRLAQDKNDRLMFAGLIIIAANAGGAWSPIGDVTTTMLWINGRISAGNIIVQLIVPALICLLVSIFFFQAFMKGEVSIPEKESAPAIAPHNFQRNIVFFCGIGSLVLVPVFKSVTHLPPFMAMMLALGILWLVVEVLYRGEEDVRRMYSVSQVLRRIDTPSILFFLGILLAISAIESMGQLKLLASGLDAHLRNPNLVVLIIGLISSVVDNVPLLAATMGMYDLQQYPQDHSFWEFLAYCSGTGGSALIIGSAAGVAAMGIERINFGWYLRKIGWIALIGYLAGALAYLLMEGLFR